MENLSCWYYERNVGLILGMEWNTFIHLMFLGWGHTWMNSFYASMQCCTERSSSHLVSIVVENSLQTVHVYGLCCCHLLSLKCPKEIEYHNCLLSLFGWCYPVFVLCLGILYVDGKLKSMPSYLSMFLISNLSNDVWNALYSCLKLVTYLLVSVFFV